MLLLGSFLFGVNIGSVVSKKKVEISVIVDTVDKYFNFIHVHTRFE